MVYSTRALPRTTARCLVKAAAKTTIPWARSRIAPASAETAQPTAWKAIAAATASPDVVHNNTWPGCTHRRAPLFRRRRTPPVKKLSENTKSKHQFEGD